MLQSYFESVANSYQSAHNLIQSLCNAFLVARKHSYQQGPSFSGEMVVPRMQRVKVPINQSWAALYFELQGNHRSIAIDKRRKIYVLEDRNLEPSAISIEAGVARYRRVLAIFRASRERNLAIVSILSVVLLAIAYSNMTIFAPVKTRSTEVHVVSASPSASDKPKCNLGADKARSSAVAHKSWSNLGGVAYSHVTLRCGGKVSEYQVVKNLVSGSIVSTKKVG